MTRIADDHAAIAAARNRINGVTPSGRLFKMDGTRECLRMIRHQIAISWRGARSPRDDRQAEYRRLLVAPDAHVHRCDDCADMSATREKNMRVTRRA